MANLAQQASRSKSYDLAKTMTAKLAWFLPGHCFCGWRSWRGIGGRAVVGRALDKTLQTDKPLICFGF